MSPLLRRLLVVLAIIAAFAAAIFWFTRPKPIPVRLHEVAQGRVEATLANTRAGTVEACQRTKLLTIMGGRIEYLGVKEGDRVKKGQVLLKLWNDDQQAQQTLTLTQLELSRRRVVEACTRGRQRAARSGAQRQPAQTRFHFRVGGRHHAAPMPPPKWPPAKPPRPMSTSRKRASPRRASSRNASRSSHLSTARWRRSSARSASIRRPRRPACRRRRPST